MKIGQQKQINAFLLQTFGPEKGGALFAGQEKILTALVAQVTDPSERRRKTLIQTILPRIALYKALVGGGGPAEDAYEHMRTYMLKIVATQKHAATVRMERIPGFYALYSRAFLKIMVTSDLWKSEAFRDGDSFGADIKQCLWYSACVENGCGELCRLFCDVDNVTYGGLKKLGFSRTKTLGYGGDCCDFRFFKK